MTHARGDGGDIVRIGSRSPVIVNGTSVNDGGHAQLRDVRPNVVRALASPKTDMIAASLVPPMTTAMNSTAVNACANASSVAEGEHKRIWNFANAGLYLLSTPALGTSVPAC